MSMLDSLSDLRTQALMCLPAPGDKVGAPSATRGVSPHPAAGHLCGHVGTRVRNPALQLCGAWAGESRPG